MLRAAMQSNPKSSALVDLRALSALSPARRVDALVSRPDARAAVRSLAPFGLYHLVREVGLDDCAELVTLASDAQIQAFVDLDCWRRDEVDTASLLPWLRVFLDAPDKHLARYLVTADPEPLVLLLKENLISFHLEDGIPPAEIDETGTDYETLDGVWAYSFLTEDDDVRQVLRQLLRRMYHIDILRARAVLESAMFGLKHDMTETAFRDRAIRLAEMGFVPFDEAAALYARRDLGAIRRKVVGAAADKSITETTLGTAPLPDLFRERFVGGTFLEDCIAVAHLPDALAQQIVAVSNKALAAEPADPRDLEAVRQTFDRVRGLLDIGLEFLAGGNVALGADILETAHPQTIVEAGHNVVLGLADQARRVFGAPEVRAALTLIDDVPYSLLDADDRGMVEGLLRPRPLYHGVGDSFARPFGSSADARTAASRLTMLAFEVTALYGLLGVTPDTLRSALFRDDVHPAPELVTIGTLVRTSVILWALGAPEALRPITLAELGNLVPIRAKNLFAAASEKIDASGALESDARAVADAWLRRVTAALEDELGGLSRHALGGGEVTARMLGSAILVVE